MSGGYFNYNCFRISQFADDLDHEIKENGRNIDVLSDETIEILTRCCQEIADAGEIAKEIEWLFSGDHGEESFTEAYMRHAIAKLARTEIEGD